MELAGKRERLRDSLLREAGLEPETPEAEAYLQRLRQEWLAENAGAIASFNDYVERIGLPLEGYRQF